MITVALNAVDRVFSIPWSAENQLELVYLVGDSRGFVESSVSAQERRRRCQCLLATNPSLLLAAIVQFYAFRQHPPTTLDQLIRFDFASAKPIGGPRNVCNARQYLKSFAKTDRWKKFFGRRPSAKKWRRQLRRLLREFCGGKSHGKKRLVKRIVSDGLCRQLAELTRTQTIAQRHWSIARQLRRSELWQLNRREPPTLPWKHDPSSNGGGETVLRTPENDQSIHSPATLATPVAVASLATESIERSTPTESVSLENLKLQSLRRLAYGASHEINNPLANIAMRSQALARGETNPDRRQKLLSIHQQAMRAHEMISDLMLFAHPPQPQWTEFSLNDVIQNVIDTYRNQVIHSGLEIKFQPPSKVDDILCGDQSMLTEMLRALTDNAIQAIRPSGSLTWSWRRDDDQFRLSILDTGPGIPCEIRDHVFDPFFSGREAGRGLGFGLSKAWRIVELHRGAIVCADGQPGQTRFEIRLPRQPQLVRPMGVEDSTSPMTLSGF